MKLELSTAPVVAIRAATPADVPEILRMIHELAVYERLEWAVLDWNQSAIDFYQAQGAEALDGWMTYRVAGEKLARLAAGISSISPFA